MFSQEEPLNFGVSIPALNAQNQLQQLKTTGSQARPSNASPNPVASQGSLTAPQHVQSVQAQVQKTSDVSSKVTVTFKRNPQDYLFVDTRVFVSGYKANPAPVQVASGQSPVSFSLENTGEPVTVTVQSSGNLGQAPLSTAPTTTLQLVKTPLASVATAAGNGPGTGQSTAFEVAPMWWNNGDGSSFAYDPGNNGNFGTGTANQVKFWMIRIPLPLKVTKLSTAIAGGEASGAKICAFAVYSADGQTKLISWDNIDVSTNGAKNTSISPVILPAGVYCVAMSNANAANATNTGGAYSTRGSSAAGDQWTNNGTIRQGVGTNSMSGGVMPSSLGTLTTSSFLQNHLAVVTMES